jgi:O-antigen/teichoic acid export membrane protein
MRKGENQNSRFRSNAIANFIGKFWVAITSILLVPLYVKFLGVEAYGLVGVYASLLSITSIFDAGISLTLTRELSSLFTKEEAIPALRNLVRTLEFIYWGIALGIIVALCGIIPWLSTGWLSAKHLSGDALRSALMLMSAAIAFRFPIFLYYGGLLGLQHQVLLNSTIVVAESIRGLGSVLILWLVSPTIEAFFLWQSLVSLIQAVVTSYYFWQKLPKSKHRAKFQLSSLEKIWHFAAGMSGFSILSLLVIQIDKILLSRLVSLEEFAYYTLATTLGYAPHFFVMIPVYNAIFPRFSQLVSQKEHDKLKEMYSQISQILSVVLISIGVLLALFSYEIVLLWVGDSALAGKISLLVGLVASGTTLHSLVHLPYAAQFAYGTTKLAIRANIIAIILQPPIIIYLTSLYGVVSGAIVWLVLNVSYILILVPLIHRSVLSEYKVKWLLTVILMPLLGILPPACLSRMLLPSTIPPLATLVWVIVTGGIMILCGSLATPYTRRQVKAVMF